MTILPKKKSKDKVAAIQQPQSLDNDESDDEDQHEEGGAAGGHTPPLELEEQEHLISGYTHYQTHNDFYERHYSSGESSPELPVISKVRYRGGSNQKKADSTHPGSPNYSGYNSGEEYDGSIVYYDDEKERLFEEALKRERNFIIKRMRPDGACLFRSVADQVYGDQDMHSVVRHNCMEYMSKNSEYFSQFVTEDFERYISRKRSERCYGNNLEMQAIAEMYNRCIEVYQYSTEPINIFFGVYKTDNPPIRLSYHGAIHYNSVVDPYKATVGVGLGLAGHKPGIADKNQMSKAKKESEMVYLEKSMLEDKLVHSDWEATYEAVEQAVARESYLLWLREQEQRTKGTVGESSNQSTVLSRSVDISLPVPLSSSSTVTNIPTTSKSKSNSQRARSRSRSSPRSQSPATLSTQIGRRPSKEGRGTTSSPKITTRSSPRPCNSTPSSRRSSPLHSPRGTPDRSPRSSPLATHRLSLDSNSLPTTITINTNRSDSGSPQFTSGQSLSPPMRGSLTPPIRGSLTPPIVVDSSSRSHDVPAHSPTPPTSVDYESGRVLTQLPYEYSSFINLPPSAFGLLNSWESEEDPELAAVLAASQQEYLDELKRSGSTNTHGAESL